MNRLIFVEGLPGTGKTTISQWLFNLLQASGKPTVLLLEFDEKSPSNFCHMAGIPKDIFNSLYTEKIKTVYKETNNFIYLKIDKCPENIQQELKRWDIGDEFNTLLSLHEYIKCTLEWWQNWVNDNKNLSVTVLDSAFLQNPINEMIFRKASNADVKSYISAIADILVPFSPLCIYLRRNNAEESINFAKAAKGLRWAAGIDGLKDIGCADLFERRFVLEYELLSTMEHLVCEINGHDWTEAKAKIHDYFKLE